MPPPTDPNVYIFTVIGEVIVDGRVRCWITPTTLRDLAQTLGSTKDEVLSAAIRRTLASLPPMNERPTANDEQAEPLEIDAEDYDLLTSRLPGLNDDHRFQLLVQALRAKPSR